MVNTGRHVLVALRDYAGDDPLTEGVSDGKATKRT